MIDISGHLRSYKDEKGFEDKDNFITVNCCGYQKFITKNLTRVRENGRLDYQILYITKGKGNFIVEGSMTDVPEGNIVIYPPGVEQKYTYYFKDTPEIYWVHFTGYGVDQILSKSGLPTYGVLHIGLNNQCIEVFKRIIYELQIKKQFFDQGANAAFNELVVLLGRSRYAVDNNKKRKSDSNFDKILELMHSSYNLKWSVHDFAKRCNISSYRFIHKFTETMGMAPLEYLTGIRMEKAKELLVSSSLNISEISEIVGYENPLYFSRVFKKVMDISPTQYRNLNS